MAPPTHLHNELLPESSDEMTRCSHQICTCFQIDRTSPASTRTTAATSNTRHSKSADDLLPSIYSFSPESNMTNRNELLLVRRGRSHRPTDGRYHRRVERSSGNIKLSSSSLYPTYLLVGLLASLLLTTLVKFSAAAVADQHPVFSTGVSSHHQQHAGQSSGPSLCPLVPNCHCKWASGKQTADCRRHNLATIPDNLLPETQNLELSGNPLVQLGPRVFQDKHLTNLQRLHLSECRISYIADDAFAHLTNLVEIDLSHNMIQIVPSKAFWPLKSSLRKLSLAYNPIQTIESEAFTMMEKLANLDLTGCQLNQLKPYAFHKLDQMRELKLADNNLTQLPLNVVSSLKEYSILDLFGNPWHCDCELRQTIDMMKHRTMQLPIEPTCATPSKFKDQRWINIKAEDFFCPPIVINKHNELVVGAGSNVSLACSARGSPPLTFIWFQDEKNLTTGRANSSEPPASTKLLEEKRYEIAEEIMPGSYGQPNITTSILYLYDLKITDTSLFLCWVDNIAGSSFANFSLVVNDSPATPAASGSAVSIWLRRSFGQTETQVGIVIIGFVILLAATILLLLLVKHNNNGSSKSSQSSDLKKSSGSANHLQIISSANKFSQQRRNSVLTDSDDDADNQSAGTGADSDGGEQRSTSSGSSCRKNPKVMGAGELNGFIEHMRSGIINMDYHSMSPVIQFNNTLKGANNAVNKQQQHNHYLDTTAMHHFPSASNASSVPYYTGNRSASMATTTSDLSPSSGSMNANFATSAANIESQPTTNCDLQRHQLATTASYTSDYQSGYSAEDPAAHQMLHHHQMMYDPMMVDFHPQQQFNPTNNSHLYQQAPLVDAVIRPQSMLYNPSTMEHHHHQQEQQNDDLVLQTMLQNGGHLPLNQRHHLDHQLHIL